MNLLNLSESVNDVLLDEQLLRLLCYVPKTAIDDPYSHSKPDILTMSNEEEKWNLINYHLMTAPSFVGLDEEPLTRLVYYAGMGKATDGNYFTNQQYYFDIYTHYTIQNLTRRLEAVSDKINELLFHKHIAGMGRTLFIARQPINPTSLPNGYVGFRLVYELCVRN